MCIIVYKPSGKDLPSKETLRTCFKNNGDGAGFMWNNGTTVEIRKGFMGFTSFWKALRQIENIKDREVVMHFRITTQGGTRKDCTHPFPISQDMNELRRLKNSCEIGVAHNGIIDLTSRYSKDIDYSDTMEFITKYLSLMVTDWSYYKDHNILTLIERLVGSKLCILDAKGHVELIGKFTEDNGIFYSNDSYIDYTTRFWKDYSIADNEINAQWIDEEAKLCYDELTDTYYFDDMYCPYIYGSYKYCKKCINKDYCYGKDELKEEVK